MVNTMGWNERSDPDMRTANFCDVYREGVYTMPLDQSAVNYTAQKGEALFRRLQTTSLFIVVSIINKIIIIGMLKSC